MLELSLELLRLFSDGTLSGAAVRRIAQAAWNDGWGRGDALAQRLVSAGNYGEYSGNIQRDILNAARLENLTEDAPETYKFQVPGPGGQPRDAECVLVHEMHYKTCLRDGVARFCLGEERLGDASGLGHLLTTWARHDDVALGRAPTDVAPIGLHGDGVTYTRTIRAGATKSVYAISFNYLVGSPKQRSRRFLFANFRKAGVCDCGCSGFHTFDAAYAVLAWSTQCLRDGVAPNCRHDGTPWSDLDRRRRLPAGTRIPLAALLQVRGDWDWFVQSLRLRHVSSERFCFLCDATHMGPMSYRRFSPDALHRTTLTTHNAFLLGCAGARVNPSELFGCPGLEIDKHFALDSMHAGDLGAFQDTLGSLFWVECTNKQWHRTNNLGLRDLNLQLGHYYRANPNYAKVVMSWQQIRGGDGYPTLKAKAAQTRQAAHFGLFLAVLHARGAKGRPAFAFRASSRLAPYSAEYRRLVVACLQGLVDYLDACEDEENFDADECRRGMFAYLSAMQDLHALWRRHLGVEDHGSQPWHIRPKCHLLQHLVQDQLDRWGSPRRFWCYMDEDYMGDIKNIAAKSTHPKTLESTVMKKVQLGSGIRAWLLNDH